MKTRFNVKLSALVSMLVLFMILSSQVTSAAESETPVNLIPVMTSNTAPSGIASASSIWSAANHQPFQVFDGKDTDYGWSTAAGQLTGWIAYEFDKPVAVNKYTLKPRNNDTDFSTEAAKAWTFEGWDGANWVVLDTRADITGWVKKVSKEFTFTNDIAYKKYRLNITKNNGNTSYVTLGEMQMFYIPTKVVTPEPTPTPTPEPTPTPQPSGDRAILVVTMDTGLEKEFDLSMSEVEAFISWYENKQAGSGKATYAIDKHSNNKGPFSSRKDYVIFNKVLTFEVSEYSAS